jgi:multidrug efflux system membrane fusion protein
VPAQAVQNGQKGAYIYVVKDDSTVAYRPVTPGMLYQGEVVIEDGLQEGEPVVIDGQMQLADGVKVEDKGRATPSSEGQAAPQTTKKSRSAS